MNEDRPVYLRLRDRIAAMILEGRVRDGDPLPSVRSLAADFGANPLTVAKAYQTFQEEGLVVVKRGVGMFVAVLLAGTLMLLIFFSSSSGYDDEAAHFQPENDDQ